jgi:hypothetical protein
MTVRDQLVLTVVAATCEDDCLRRKPWDPAAYSKRVEALVEVLYPLTECYRQSQIPPSAAPLTHNLMGGP